MRIHLTVTLPNNETYRALLAVLYAERKRITDHSDHARAHGDFYTPEVLPAIDSLLDGLQYGEVTEGPPPRPDRADSSAETDALAELRRRAESDND